MAGEQHHAGPLEGASRSSDMHIGEHDGLEVLRALDNCALSMLHA